MGISPCPVRKMMGLAFLGIHAYRHHEFLQRCPDSLIIVNDQNERTLFSDAALR
jgi:hypothetical protein